MTATSELNDKNESKPCLDWLTLVDFFYGAFPRAKQILVEHSWAVADMALEINRKKKLGLRPEDVELAAMLHDIGIIGTDASGIGCTGTEPYIRHGILGADMLRAYNAPEWAARVAERHTGVGLTPDDITRQNLPLPTERVLLPETMLEKLICYADKFFSKRPGQLSLPKSLDQVRTEIGRHGADSLSRFEALHHLFS